MCIVQEGRGTRREPVFGLPLPDVEASPSSEPPRVVSWRATKPHLFLTLLNWARVKWDEVWRTSEEGERKMGTNQRWIFSLAGFHHTWYLSHISHLQPRRFAFKFGFTGEIYSFDASMENRELKNIRFEGQRRLGQVGGRAGDGLQIRRGNRPHPSPHHFTHTPSRELLGKWWGLQIRWGKGCKSPVTELIHFRGETLFYIYVEFLIISRFFLKIKRLILILNPCGGWGIALLGETPKNVIGDWWSARCMCKVRWEGGRG